MIFRFASPTYLKLIYTLNVELLFNCPFPFHSKPRPLKVGIPFFNLKNVYTFDISASNVLGISKFLAWEVPSDDGMGDSNLAKL